MPKRRPSAADALFPIKRSKPVPHDFVLEALAQVPPRTRPMFGCLAVYVGPRIVLILREKRDGSADDGVWIATTAEHHQSLRREFPNMRSIRRARRGGHTLATASGRRAGFRRSGAARLRTDPGRGPSNRQSAEAAAREKVNCGALTLYT